MCKGGWLVYVRAPRDCPENLELRKPILEKNKKDLEKMKFIKFYPYSPYIPTQKKKSISPHPK